MSNIAPTFLTRRLATFYALYFALLGCIAPYWGLFLQHKHFNPEQIGLLMGAFGLMRVVAPNLWAHWGRYFRSPLQMVRTSAVLTLLCFTLIGLVDTPLGMGMVMMLYGFFWAAMLPQYELMTMQACANEVGAYSRIRVWGSLGFVATVLAAGALFEQVSVGWLPLLMVVLIAVITVNSFRLPDAAATKSVSPAPGAFWQLLRSRPVQVFILMTILLQVSHGPYYTFFSIYLQQQGYPSSLIGVLWSVGVSAEVLLFWTFQRLVHWCSWRLWCVISLIITAIRWWLVGTVAEVWWLLLLAQLGHAFSFAVMHAVSMRYVQQLFPPALQSRGQALYASVGFGLGGALGAFLSGWLWQPLGGAGVFIGAGVLALAGALVAWYGLQDNDTVLMSAENKK